MEDLILTPKGICQWAKIFRPDPKYDDYSIDQILSKEDGEPIADLIREAIQTFPGFKKILADAKAKDNPHPKGGPVKGLALPPFIELEDGSYKFSFKEKSEGGPKDGEKFPIHIDVFDAKKNPWPKNILIGNGSTVRISYYLWTWNHAAQGGIGVSLRFRAVQVVNLVPYEKPERDYGFATEEGTDTGNQLGSELPPQSTGGPVVDDIPF